MAIENKDCFTDLTLDNQLYEIAKAIESIDPSGVGGTAYYGQVSRITSGTINIATAGTYQSTGLTATLDAENVGVSLGTTDLFAVKNTSGSAQLLKIYGSADIDAGNNTILGIKLALNGTPIDNTECNAATGQGTTFAKLVTNWMIELQPNDEVALFVTNKTTAGNVTLLRGRLVASTVGKQGPEGPQGPTGPAVDTSNFVQKSGDTMTGKLVAAADLAASKLNIGNAIGTPGPATIADGDLWISNQNKFAWRTNGNTITAAGLSQANTFNQPQTIVSTSNATPVLSISNTGTREAAVFNAQGTSPAVRITQTGAGEALRVEDDTTPDATAFVISNLGRVGIGVTPDATVSLSVDTTGLKFGDGTIQTTAATGSTVTPTDVQVFTSSGTWTKPAGAKSLHVVAISGGGGGGSGRKSASGTAAAGGGGGGGGAYSERFIDASLVGATEAITVGVGGTGGAAVTANSANGNIGTTGGTSAFGSLVVVTGGAFGSGGSTTSGVAGAGSNRGLFAGAAGNAGAAGGGVAGNNSAGGGAGGGSGAGITAAGVPAAGGNGGIALSYFATATFGGTGGPINTNGNDGPNVASLFPAASSGGGAGGSSVIGNGGNGGNGGNYGGGGAGGGAAINGSGNSGAGGNGGNGIVIITTYF